MENPDGISPTKMVFNMLNQIIGIGIITYHTNVFAIGIIPCIIASIVYGYITSFAAHLLIKSSLRCKKSAWGDIVMDLFGVAQFLIFNVILVLACIVFASSYLSAAGEWFTSTMPVPWKRQIFGDRSDNFVASVLLIATSSLSLAASMIRNAEKFAKVSIISNIISVASLFAVIVCSISHQHFEKGIQEPIAWMTAASNANASGSTDNAAWKLATTIGILCTTYVYIQISLQLFYSLKKPSLPTWHKAEFSGMTVVIILNIVVGVLGYFAFKLKHLNGNQVKDNILENFDNDNVIITICKIGYAISILLSFPMQMLSGRLSAAFLYNYCLGRKLDQELSGVEFRVITIVIWMLCVLLGIFGVCFGIKSILSVGGCFVGCYMGFVLPAACYLWSRVNKTEKTLKPLENVIAETAPKTEGSETAEVVEMTDTSDVDQSEMKKEKKETKMVIPDEMVPEDTLHDKIGAWFMFVVGIVLMFGGTIISGIDAYLKTKN